MRIEHGACVWRPMTNADLPAVSSIADRVHVNYPEDDAVLFKRFALYPKGCAILDCNGVASGYAVTHPWRYGEPPALNTSLGKLPDQPTTYYIHDFVVLPETRGIGAGSAFANTVVLHARELALPNVSLVAVNRSVPFWSRFGFEIVAEPELAAALLSYDAEARFMVRRI
jgi:GNAT superfamily N-acetyltransferase